MAASAASTSIHQLSGRTSTRMGRAFTSNTEAAVACQVRPGTMTSSPIPIPQASRASWSVTVPFAAQIAYVAPVNAANAALNARSLLRCTTRLRSSTPPGARFLPFHRKPATMAMGLRQRHEPGRHQEVRVSTYLLLLIDLPFPHIPSLHYHFRRARSVCPYPQDSLFAG